MLLTPESAQEAEKIFDWIVKVSQVLILPAVMYIGRRFEAIDRKLETLTINSAETKVTLVGQNGNNGLMSRVSSIEAWRNSFLTNQHHQHQ